MMNLLIAGSRNFTNYLEFKLRVDKLLKRYKHEDILIIEGGARGADRLARQYAEENNIKYKTFEADWEKEGKKAGILRNIKMADVATHAIIFWDGNSVGTKHMISLCEEKEIKFVVIKVKTNESSNT